MMAIAGRSIPGKERRKGTSVKVEGNEVGLYFSWEEVGVGWEPVQSDNSGVRIGSRAGIVTL